MPVILITFPYFVNPGPGIILVTAVYIVNVKSPKSTGSLDVIIQLDPACVSPSSTYTYEPFGKSSTVDPSVVRAN